MAIYTNSYETFDQTIREKIWQMLFITSHQQTLHLCLLLVLVQLVLVQT